MRHVWFALPALGLLMSTAAAQMSAGDLKKKLHSNDQFDREEAYAAIAVVADEKEREKAVAALAREYDAQLRAYKKAAAAIEGTVAGWDRNLEAKEALVAAWVAAAETAGNAIFDTTAFPTPNGPVSGPYIGFDHVDEVVRTMREKYDALRATVDQDLARVRRLARPAARKLVEAIRAALDRANELGAQLERYRDEIAWPASVSAFARAMIFVQTLEWGPALTLYDGKQAAPPQVQAGGNTNAPAVGGMSGGPGGAPGGPAAGAGGAAGGGPAAPAGGEMPAFGPSLGSSYGAADNPFWRNPDAGRGQRVDSGPRGTMYDTGESGRTGENDYSDPWDDEEPAKKPAKKPNPFEDEGRAGRPGAAPECGSQQSEVGSRKSGLLPSAFRLPPSPGSSPQPQASSLSVLRTLVVACCVPAGPERAREFGSEPGPGFDGYQRALFFFLYVSLVDEFNEQVEVAGISKAVREAVAYNNDYRASLRMAPLQIHPELTQAMIGHLEEEAAMGYFAHEGRTPETRSMADRVRRQGYPIQRVGENLSQGGLRSAMDRWRWDGGHHRNLVNPTHHHIGAAEHGDSGSGMDVASGGTLGLPILHFRR